MIDDMVINPVFTYLVATAPELVLLGCALLLMLADFLVPSQRDRFPMLAASGAAVALWLSWHSYAGPHMSVYGGAIAVDEWTAIFRMIACLSAIATLLLALPRGFLAPPASSDAPSRSVRGGDFAILILLSTAGMCLMAASRDYLVTVLAMEIMSLAIYPLITLARTRSSLEAATKYFLMGAVGSAIMLFGVSFLFGVTGTTRYVPLSPLEGRTLFGFLLVAVGFFFKLAVVPFHAWLLDAYEAAPASLGAFMAAGVKAAAVGAFGRLLFLVVFPQPLATPELIRAVIALSAITLFLGNAGALLQTNIARLLAYSAIAHTGFIMMGAAATVQTGKPVGLSAMLVYVLAYTPAALGAFAVVALVESASADKSHPLSSGGRDINLLKGLFRHHPFTAIAFAICAASLAGLPPTAGFWAKFEIFRASFQAGHLGLLAIALINSLLAAYYYIRLVRAAFTDHETRIAAPAVFPSLVVMVAAVLILIIGLLPGSFLLAAATAAIKLVG